MDKKFITQNLKVTFFKIIQLGVASGMCAASFLSASSALSVREDVYHPFVSAKGVGMGLFDGASTYATYELTRQLFPVLYHAMMKKTFELNPDMFDVNCFTLVLTLYGISAGYAALGAVVFDCGDPANALVAQSLGNIILIMLIALYAIIKISMATKTATVQPVATESEMPTITITPVEVARNFASPALFTTVDIRCQPASPILRIFSPPSN